MKQRLFYIDFLRGLAIFVVVMNHLSLFSFALGDGPLMKYMIIPGLPLFMMISGYFTNPEKVNILKRLKLLIPFFLLGGIYNYVYIGANLLEMMCEIAKNGYWFLWELVLFNIIVWIIHKCHIKILYGFVVIEFISLVLYFFLLRHTVIGDIIGLYYWCFLLPFFFGGIFMKQIGMEKLMEHKSWLLPCCICAIGVCCILRYCLFSGYWAVSIVNMIMAFPTSILLILVTFIIEDKYKGRMFKGKSMLKTIGSQIGQHTLEIYVLHYYIIYYIKLQHECNFLRENDLMWTEWFFNPVVAFAVIYMCIGIAKIFEKAKLGFLFGK